ncbi:MAG: hypothetical protein ABSB58_01640 [Gemmatimonadales bacterium]|jgi:hypothetical protein
MKVSKVFAAVVVLSLAGAAARAQVPGLPFYPTPTGMGILASADYAIPASHETMLALRGGIGFGPFGATAVVGQYKVTGLTSQIAYGASAAMKVFGGGMLPVSITVQGGVGQVKNPFLTTTTVTYVPVGAAVRANLPLFPIKPFAVGYYVLGSNVKKEFRLTVGADFNILLGLGVHAAYDMGSANTWGIGAHFNFRMPVM